MAEDEQTNRIYCPNCGRESQIAQLVDEAIERRKSSSEITDEEINGRMHQVDGYFALGFIGKAAKAGAAFTAASVLGEDLGYLAAGLYTMGLITEAFSHDNARDFEITERRMIMKQLGVSDETLKKIQ